MFNSVYWKKSAPSNGVNRVSNLKVFVKSGQILKPSTHAEKGIKINSETMKVLPEAHKIFPEIIDIFQSDLIKF